MMNMPKILNVIFLVVFLAGCKNHARPAPGLANDTVKVMQLALRSALLDYKLPEISPLFTGHLFHDSILVVTDSFPGRLLPVTLGTLNFKFVSHQQVAKLMRTVADTSKPNFLYICCFEKVDSVYSVFIASRSDVPLGGGGSTLIDVVNRGDSLVVKHYSSNSIN